MYTGLIGSHFLMEIIRYAFECRKTQVPWCETMHHYNKPNITTVIFKIAYKQYSFWSDLLISKKNSWLLFHVDFIIIHCI